jgi:hypothetical protein
MNRQPHNGHYSYESSAPSTSTARRKRRAITTAHKLLTDSWTAEVQAMETAIGRFESEEDSSNDCRIVFFEIDGDRLLHVNVTHASPTTAVRGWAGPGRVPEGFVHNRRFHHVPRSRILRRIHDMAFAATA